jgi:hypothetical protein
MEPSAPIRPAYWSNGRVVLYEGEFSASYADDVVQYEGAVFLDWQPKPRVTWQGTSSASTAAIAEFEHWQRPDPAPPAVALPVELPSGTRRRGAYRPRRVAGTVRTSGTCDGMEFHRPGSDQCDVVTFNLINGPDLTPLEPLRHRGYAWSGRWHLRDESWVITLDARRDLRERMKLVKRTNGYTFTHVGALRRSDGAPFNSSTAKGVLDGLFLFLTLIHSATVGIALPVGTLDGETTWRRWTSGLSSPYRGFSWADPHTPADLAQLWPNFRSARRDPRWSNALLRAVRHYAEANQAVSTEVTLTLAQAALELLGTAICVDRDTLVPADKWETKKAAWKIRRLLRSRVPLDIPKAHRALARAAKTHAWSDGPQAVTALRNTVTHWTTGKPTVDNAVWIEASQLSVYYLEMALLSALDYHGRALDRTTRPLIVGGSKLVPWATRS